MGTGRLSNDESEDYGLSTPRHHPRNEEALSRPLRLPGPVDSTTAKDSMQGSKRTSSENLLE